MRKISAGSLILAVLSVVLLNVVAHGQSRDELLEQLKNKRAEIQKLEEQFLAVGDADRAAFAEFLKQPETGLIRLLPRETFHGTRDKPSPLTVLGGGAYYSFVRLTHEYGYGSDIQLEQNYLSVGFAGADYGIMTMLDEVPLENVTSELPPVGILLGYNPPTEDASARQEGRSFWPEKVLNGLTFSRRLPAKVNATYLLRSISFDRSDVLVALRVVRKDTDGSLIIAWKLLNKYPVPKLARAK